ncbi:MAG: porphobilinogen synthase [Flavobacteriales bacterium]|nr:porphobilinogen synthase [Flavobacteriales bacterium]
MQQRPRRNRKSETIREMVTETRVSVSNLIFPLFVMDGMGKQTKISSMPNIARFTPDLLYTEVEECMNLGLKSFVIFPAVEDALKDKEASYSWDPDNFYLKVIRGIKSRFPEVCLMSDVAMDPYSSDGHDGYVENGEIINDLTLPILGKMALAQAEAGIDILGPSDMMDGRVGFIRNVLDENGFTGTSIMSYTAKYASAYYGPFRDALDSAPKFGDKKTYQMNPANKREALIEAELDEAEGADFLMVKPALCYLDIIHLLKENSHLPVAAYNVSGEYAMLKAAGEKGWINYDKAMLEMLLSIKRAGADIILTYFAKEFAMKTKNGSV